MKNTMIKALTFVLAIVLLAGATVASAADVHEHKWNAGVVTSAPTCSSKGSKTVTCTVCGAIKTVEIAVNPKNHNWSEWIVTKAATCSKTGVKTRTCSRDRSHVETEIIPTAAHTPVSAGNGVAATCVSDGREADSICLVCGSTIKTGVVISATGTHTYVWNSDSVNHWKECSVCGAVQEGSRVKHTGGQATCGSPAVCTVCGNAYSGSTGHNYREIVTVPTCTGRGYTTHICNTCGQSYVDGETPALGHREVVDEGTPVTCTTDGITEGKHCNVCGLVTVAREVIVTTGHKMVTDAAVPATCRSTGLSEGSHCAVCGLVQIAQTETGTSDHVAGDWVAVTPSVCENGGVLEQHCIFCGLKMASREVEALGHDEAAWDHDEDGHCVVCSRCGTKGEKEVHVWDAGTVTVAADYGVEGITTHTCICGATYTERVPALQASGNGNTVIIIPPTTSTVIQVSAETETTDDFEDFEDFEELDIGDEETALGALPTTFTDVKADSWSAKSIAFVCNNRLMDSVGKNTFAPALVADRATIVCALYRMEKSPRMTAVANPFTDISAEAGYRDAAIWASWRGITNGVGAGRFDASGTCTREQAVTFLYRYAQLKHRETNAAAELSGFADAAQVSGYAVPAMRWAVAKGLIEGYNGRIDPQGTITREQLAAILYRFDQTCLHTK